MQQNSQSKPLTPNGKKQLNIEQIKFLIQTNYFVTMLMQIKGNKIQSEKENLTFLTLCLIHAHD